MRKNQRKKETKQRKSIILRLVLLAFSAYCIYSISSYAVDLIKIKQESAEVIKQNNETQLAVDELQHMLDSEDNSEIIEHAARDKLGYVYSYEQVYTDISNN
ncbi:MAG TPA: septum formation initiator family protein [Firmicutes bacterium]|nr:septum formation initiator family protein [Bacillota bacterium]